jgi:molecular chaperone Hsp33
MMFENSTIRSRDSLQRFLFEHAPIRGEIVHLDATWQAVLERRKYPPAVRLLLGEAMAAAALLSATIKLAGRLVIQIQGPGPITLLVAECTGRRTLRATAKWRGVVPDGPLSEAVGRGRLAITLDPSEGRERYQGIVELVGNNIASALENYFARSEQLPTRLWLAADARRAAGMLLQRLPAAGSTDADAWPRATALGNTLSQSELLRHSARDLIHRLYHEEDIRVFDSIPLGFRCSCSRERVVNTLRMLGADEVASILHDQGSVNVSCEFCAQRYEFDRVDVKQLFTADVIAPASVHIH